jgi:hypothetical protein
VTAPQSLDLINNELMVEWAQSVAGRILNDSGLSPEAQIDRAFRLVFGRAASKDEQKIASDFLNRQMPILAERLASANKPPLPAAVPAGMEAARAAAFVDLSQMLMASNEFLYIN